MPARSCLLAAIGGEPEPQACWGSFWMLVGLTVQVMKFFCNWALAKAMARREQWPWTSPAELSQSRRACLMGCLMGYWSGRQGCSLQAL